MSTSDLSNFGEEHFGTVKLGHKARNACVVKLANLLRRHPGGTLPDKLSAPKDYKALMRLVHRPEVTHASVLQPHRQRTVRLMEQSESQVLLLVHDATTLDYSSLKSLANDLGPIGDGRGRGYLCHNSLAIDPQRRQVLGLANQILHHCDTVPKNESVAAKRLRDNRESRLWTKAVQQIGSVAPEKLVIDVCDRGADIFEFLSWEVKHGRHFVVRSTYNRALLLADGADQPAYLHDYARTLPALDHKTITIQGRNGSPDRQAKIAVSAGPATVLAPHVKRGEHDRTPLRLWMVRVWEPNPPADCEAVEWLLLTTEVVEQPSDAWLVVSWYECRWMVEEFHKAMKTGCDIEELQFASIKGLEPTIALLSVVATTLLNLRSLSRSPEAKTTLATDIVDASYVAVLSLWRYKKKRDLTVHEFFYALARLGGHQNRKCDGQPGWLVLWRGWTKLELLHTGYEIRGET